MNEEASPQEEYAEIDGIDLPDLDDILQHSHTATYCPEDNKLRFYPDWSDGGFDKEVMKAAGYRWASKQECYVAPRWTPDAEDAALKHVDEIEDEDYSPQERAADRAERFSVYRDKRSAEAHGIADRYDAGPSVFGGQNARRVERQAARHDRLRGRACSRWSKAEYWQSRTAGVISNALHKSDAVTRRRRILRIEAEHRGLVKSMEEYATRFAGWQKVLTLDGGDCKCEDCPVGENQYGIDGHKATQALKLAYTLSNDGRCRMYGHHPDDPSEYHSAYDLLTGVWKSGGRLRQMTPHEVANALIRGRTEPHSEHGSSMRWKRHYELRRAYENQMLENEGGKASEVEMVVGGFFRGHQIHKINKSPATGRVTSVEVWGNFKTYRKGELVVEYGRCVLNGEKYGESAYRAPTDEELAAFNAAKAEKKKAKAAEPKGPSLVNPTLEDAEKLQGIWNAANPKHEPGTVWEMTQQEYSLRSKQYGPCGTSEVNEHGTEMESNCWGRLPTMRTAVFKVRRGSSRTLYGTHRVVVITDKPQKPIPWMDIVTARMAQPTEESLFDRIEEIASLACRNSHDDRWTDEESQLFSDAQYVRWAYSSSVSQFGLTEKGNAKLKEFREKVAAPVGQLF
jgi:hypothetical protein